MIERGKLFVFSMRKKKRQKDEEKKMFIIGVAFLERQLLEDRAMTEDAFSSACSVAEPIR